MVSMPGRLEEFEPPVDAGCVVTEVEPEPLLRPEEFCLETTGVFKLPEEFWREREGLSRPPPPDRERETSGEMDDPPVPAALVELGLCPMGLAVREGLEVSLCPEELGLDVRDPMGLDEF